MTKEQPGTGEQSQNVEYEPPKLELLGTLEELTEAGRTNPGVDFQIYKDGQRGSVITPNG